MDEYRSGQRREGLFYSVVTLLQMLATAFAVWLVGVILGQAGYDPDAETLTDSAMWAIRLIMAVGPAVFALFVGLMAILQPMTKAKHSALTDADRCAGPQEGRRDRDRRERLRGPSVTGGQLPCMSR